MRSVLLIICLMASVLNAKPFWTEKSSYVEGGRVYFVGVATGQKSIEKGRNEALANAKQELTNYLQLSNITGVKFNTQMTYEEKTTEGFTVYRLMFVEQEIVDKVLAEKNEVERINVEKKLKNTEAQIKEKESLIKKAEAQEKKLAEKQTELEKIYSRIGDDNSKIKQVPCGATRGEVTKILGSPRSTSSCLDQFNMAYGKYWIILKSGIVHCISGSMDSACSTNCYGQFNKILCPNELKD